jgi:hypothetical protein
MQVPGQWGLYPTSFFLSLQFLQRFHFVYFLMLHKETAVIPDNYRLLARIFPAKPSVSRRMTVFQFLLAGREFPAVVRCTSF